VMLCLWRKAWPALWPTSNSNHSPSQQSPISNKFK
jgi:hypothetical protein